MKHSGHNAVLKLDGITAASLTAWTIEQNVATVETTGVGYTSKTFKTAILGYSISMEGYYDSSDPTMLALVPGASLAFELLPGPENLTQQKRYTGQLIIQTLSENANPAGLVAFSSTAMGNAALIYELI